MNDRPRSSHGVGTGEIAWRDWSPETFAVAERLNRPVLLNLTAVWCHSCRLMDETTFADPDLIALINDNFVPLRVDADRLPHVQDRYTAGGWPTNAFLTPTGEVLWSATFVTAEQLRAVADSVMAAWSERKGELQSEIERRRKAMDASRSRQPATGLVRREAADDVITAAQATFDPRNGGFGTEPKFPYAEAVELLYTQGRRTGNTDWLEMADRTLDGMLAGELFDQAEGGFFRYALAADWTSPRHEKLLETNAGLLRAYALGANLRTRDDWRTATERIVGWVEKTLVQRNGLWGGSEAAGDEYYTLDAMARTRAEAPFVDDVLYTNRNAEWIGALADAGARLGRTTWIERAAEAFDQLIVSAAAPGDVLYHYVAADGTRGASNLLVDVVAVAHAALVLYQASGRAVYLEHTRRLVRGLERTLWADEGGFRDHLKSGDDVGSLRYPDRPFELNASAARLLLDLSLVTGERGYRALAERILAVLSPLAGRYGVSGAVFALAVGEFFEPPFWAAVIGDGPEADALRAAALRIPEPDRRVWSLAQPGRVGGRALGMDGRAAAYACGPRACSAAVHEPERLLEVARSVR
jgi:uncharacterized protein YyaL (SSP411 family)